MNTTTQTPKEIDLQLAALWTELYKTEQRLDSIEHGLLSLANAEFYYRGRRRVTDMKVAEAIEILNAEIAALAEYMATHSTYEDGYRSTDWNAWNGITAPYDHERPAKALAKFDEVREQLDELRRQIRQLDELYTGWSRFFLVTSSAGHVHSSMCCSTCRPTTTYGWMPELSDTSEAEAVKQLGPTLCSVCFPSAPLDWTSGKKITAAQAAKQAA